jgi:hypothetical protein
MKLADWRTSQHLTQGELGVLVGRIAKPDGAPVGPSTVSRWEMEPGNPERRVPGPKMLEALAQLSHNQVLPNDFHNLGAARDLSPQSAAEGQPAAPETGVSGAPLRGQAA